MDSLEEQEFDGQVEQGAASARGGRIASLAVIAVFVGLAIYVYTQFGFDLDPRTLRERIAGFGWFAPAVYIVVAALRIFLFLPSGVVMSAGGLLFGVWAGLLWGLIGFSVGSVVTFGLARGLGRDAVAARLRGRAAEFDDYITRRGAPWMALYTAVPISVLTPVHMAAGLSGMTLASFALAASTGLLPRMALYSYFGDAVGEAIAQGDWTAVFVGGGVIAVLGAVGSVVVRRWGSGKRPSDLLEKDKGSD
ncbi:MAG: TVP38/TMEM64 family protein [Myxococcota bacterium]|nr:TVP38/TMEM64 family protein [Myxococcota bacterium]